MSGAETHRQEPLNTLQEFIQHQALVDWPIMHEEHFEIPPDCMLYMTSQQICESLRQKIPTNTTSTIMKDVESLWMKVRAWTGMMRLNQTELKDTHDQEEKEVLKVTASKLECPQ